MPRYTVPITAIYRVTFEMEIDAKDAAEALAKADSEEGFLQLANDEVDSRIQDAELEPTSYDMPALEEIQLTEDEDEEG